MPGSTTEAPAPPFAFGATIAVPAGAGCPPTIDQSLSQTPAGIILAPVIALSPLALFHILKASP